MWENERKKTRIYNATIFLLLILVVIGLLVAMSAVKKQVKAEDAQLKAQSSSQRQALSAERQENLEFVQQAYDKDMQTVQSYLPGIVCWGDSLTAGSAGSVSYPHTLQNYIDTYLCEIYELYSTLDNARDYSWVDWSKYTVSIPVVNMGSGREDCATVLGRSGVLPYVLGKTLEIPGGIEPVAITLRSSNGNAVTPLTAGSIGVNPVSIGGVQGTLTLVPGAGGNTYRFTRAEAGDPVSVEAGTQIVTAAAQEYRDYVHIAWVGTYENYESPESLVASVKQLLSRQAQNPDRYLVLGPCTVNGSWDGATASTMDAIDLAMMQEFGDRYINVRKYLMSDGMSAIGLTVAQMANSMTEAGLAAFQEEMALVGEGTVPTSFRSNGTDADLNGSAYNLIGKLVYRRMESLGYFDEVRQELGLDKTTLEILKTEPEYFENMLNAKNVIGREEKSK